MLFGVLSTDIMQTISFDEIVKGRDSTVRVTDDQLLYAVDLVMVMTGQARDHAGKTIRNISDAVFHSENFSERQLSTRGGAPTKQHAQWVDGAERSVNSYTEADRDLVEHAITCVCDAQSESE
jgi:hypothetical protein